MKRVIKTGFIAMGVLMLNLSLFAENSCEWYPGGVEGHCFVTEVNLAYTDVYCDPLYTALGVDCATFQGPF